MVKLGVTRGALLGCGGYLDVWRNQNIIMLLTPYAPNVGEVV